MVANPLSQLSVASWDLAVATAKLHELIKLLAEAGVSTEFVRGTNGAPPTMKAPLTERVKPGAVERMRALRTTFVVTTQLVLAMVR